MKQKKIAFNYILFGNNMDQGKSIVSLYCGGMSVPDINMKLGVPKSTIYYQIKKLEKTGSTTQPTKCLDKVGRELPVQRPMWPRSRPRSGKTPLCHSANWPRSSRLPRGPSETYEEGFGRKIKSQGQKTPHQPGFKREEAPVVQEIGQLAQNKEANYSFHG